MTTIDTAADPRGVQDLPGWVKASWVTMLVLGLVMIGLGLVLMFNLSAGVNTLRWLVFFALLLSAVEALGTASLRERQWIGWLVGAAYLIGAVVTVVWPGVTLFVLVLTVGISLLAGGLIQAVMAWRLKGEVEGWGWNLALGLISVAAGLFFIFGSTAVSLAVLAIVLGIHVAITGLTLVLLALAVRRLAQTVSSALSSP
jgi:uncharacterized membrane protein HdeD (DUF308 family)